MNHHHPHLGIRQAAGHQIFDGALHALTQLLLAQLGGFLEGLAEGGSDRPMACHVSRLWGRATVGRGPMAGPREVEFGQRIFLRVKTTNRKKSSEQTSKEIMCFLNFGFLFTGLIHSSSSNYPVIMRCKATWCIHGKLHICLSMASYHNI